MRAVHPAAVILTLALAAGGASTRKDWPATCVVVQVGDDTGQPVAGATVGVGYAGPGIDAVTDTNGVVRYRDAVTGPLTCEIQKAGFYRTAGELWRGPFYGEEAPPARVFTVVLKRIVHPVRMETREIATFLPSLEEPCSFDLQAGDWIAPYGTGTVADCEFVGWKDVKGNRDWDLRCKVLFPRPNGVIGFIAPNRVSLAVKSDLVPPQTAPTDGYVGSFEFAHSFRAGKGSHATSGRDDHYVFRVRSVTNASGQVLSANVGWVEGAMRLDGRNTKTMWMGMRYHFNPNPQSRSLEPEQIK